MTDVQSTVTGASGRKMARVVTGRVVVPESSSRTSLERRLRSALVPATMVTRYRRDWRLGQVSFQRQTVLGRIGYMSDERVDSWDEGMQDFHRTAVRLGQASPFALHLGTGRLAFQVRTTISVNAFAGAFALILAAGSQVPDWAVQVEEEPETFEEFKRSVDRVERLTLTLTPPNPNWKGRKNAEAIVGNTASDQVVMSLVGGNINTDADVARELIDHAAEYGNVSAIGQKGSSRRPWSLKSPRVIAETIVPANPETGEADPAALREVAGEQE